MKIIVLWPHDCWHKIDTKQILVFLFFHSNLAPKYMCVLSRFSPTLCNPMVCSPPASSVHGILQVRILERVAMPSSRGLSNSGVEPMSHMSPPVLPLAPPVKPQMYVRIYIYVCMYVSDQISRSVVSDSLRPHESQHARPPCPTPTPRVHRDSRPLSQ